MYSLSSRLLITVSVLLLVFFGATIAVLDTAFTDAGEQARRDFLDGHLVALLGAAEPSSNGELGLPKRLREARFGRIGSGLYGELRNAQGDLVWRSRSTLGLAIPVGGTPALGEQLFGRAVLADGTPLLTLSLSVEWEFEDASSRNYLFKVAESLDSFNAQVAKFRGRLFRWFAAVASTMLLAFSFLLRGLLKPLRKIEAEIGEIEEGSRASLSSEFPTELTGVARNLNLLIDSERARSDRYRYTLDNLAHSLKTPLAAMRALLGGRGKSQLQPSLEERFDEQIDRMDEIVRYQLRKPTSSNADRFVLQPVAVQKEVQRLIDGLQKVYHDKSPSFDVNIDDDIQFRGDTGDFLELAGNLLDNASKWCRSQIRLTITAAGGSGATASGMILSVSDDGPGIPDDAVGALLQRGTRLDESTPGHGIGLAVVKEIARSYGGRLSIERSQLGGTKVVVAIPPVTSRNNG